MNLKYLLVLVGFVCVFEAEAATSELSRAKRDDGFNVIEVFFKVQKLLSSCKKSDSSAANNQTNPIVQFIEEHDIQCLISGFVKIFRDMSPPKETSRRKRDTSNILMQFIQLQQDVEKCKKSDAPPSNSTNIIEKVMNEYDMDCLVKTLMDFVKTISQSNNHRSKRAIQLSDITCFLMKLMDSQSKIEKVIDAFKNRGPVRSKRAASSQQICDDFGTTMDAVLKLILDFAPNQSSK